MDSLNLCYKKLTENAYPPVRATAQSAGFDLFSAYNYIIQPHDKELVYTDLAIRVPDGCYGRIAPRSGLALKYHIDIGGGVIDPDYRGNIGIIVYNHSSLVFSIKKGDRIAQLICEKIALPQIKEVLDLDETERNCRGFGSTGGINDCNNEDLTLNTDNDLISDIVCGMNDCNNVDLTLDVDNDLTSNIVNFFENNDFVLDIDKFLTEL